MKKINLLLIIAIVLTCFSCSRSNSDSTLENNAPDNLNPSEYKLETSNASVRLYIYFDIPNNPFNTNVTSSLLSQGSYSNKIMYNYNKPNGTILIGPNVQGNQTPSSSLVFKENSTYSFTINGQNLTLTAEGQNFVLTKQP